MPKVLFIGHLHEKSGWGYTSHDIIRSLKSVGVDVVARSVRFKDNYIPDDIAELTHKSKSNCEYIIQHVLPNYLDYNGTYKKNIAIADLEGYDLSHKIWYYRLQQMDEVWLPNSDLIAYIPNSVWMPHPVNINYEPYCNKSETYKFYFIGEMIKRKNITAILKAFHLVFNQSKNVELILKVNRSGMSKNELEQTMKDLCHNVKQGLKLYPVEKYKEETIITDYLSDKELLDLHCSCDCLINTSYSEAWCRPVADAVSCGNTVITNDCGGPLDILQGYDNCYYVQGTMEPCFAALDTFKDLYTGLEQWQNINILDLCCVMKAAYINRKNTLAEGKKHIKDNFSYKVVGNKMLEELCQ